MSEVQDAIMSWACGYSWERLKIGYQREGLGGADITETGSVL
jgi:hypothetical protein